MAGKLLDGAREAAASVAGAARHLAWYVSYCVDGSQTRSPESARADARGERSVQSRAL